MAFALDEARKAFHGHLLSELLTTDAHGHPSNADKHNARSVELAAGILSAMGGSGDGERQSAQSAGSKFEQIVHSFVAKSLPLFEHLRPGKWHTEHVHGRDGIEAISKFDQYEHLKDLERAAKGNRQLAVALGNDYVIAPDIVVFREAVDEAAFNARGQVVDPQLPTLSPLRLSARSVPILHASISCKWTIRSDRSQNARSEALNLLRNRKGRAPHIAVVTGEPLPKRIASIALGTGDIDCVYHFALPELQSAASSLGDADCIETLEMLVEGKRLRDVADLVLDLVT